jgi:RNA polymerase sigma-70 factor (ECF subfamily)
VLNRTDRTRRLEAADGQGGGAAPWAVAASAGAALDGESRAWLEALEAEGSVREEAIARLHAMLLRASRFEVRRRRAGLSQIGDGELDDIALQSADDALLAVLSKLRSFRGSSRFSTWAYKFALLEAAVNLRRAAWRGREVPFDVQQWPQVEQRGLTPHAHAEQSELMSALRRAMDEMLTDHQRRVMAAVVLNGVPIDVLAQRLDTTRGALYKTIHDARAKLRQALEADGLVIEQHLREAGR